MQHFHGFILPGFYVFDNPPGFIPEQLQKKYRSPGFAAVGPAVFLAG
jgi:hypothetical protein